MATKGDRHFFILICIIWTENNIRTESIHLRLNVMLNLFQHLKYFFPSL